jgi:hypothetical protein
MLSRPLSTVEQDAVPIGQKAITRRYQDGVIDGTEILSDTMSVVLEALADDSAILDFRHQSVKDGLSLARRG